MVGRLVEGAAVVGLIVISVLGALVVGAGPPAGVRFPVACSNLLHSCHRHHSPSCSPLSITIVSRSDHMSDLWGAQD